MGIGRSRFAWLAALAVLALAAGVGGGYLVSRTPPPSPPLTAGGPSPSTASPRTSVASAPATSEAPRAPSPAAPGGPAATAGGATMAATTGPSAPASASPAPATAADPSTAPTSASHFDPRHTIVPMAFPLPATARYAYGPEWRTARLGVVYPYNQIRGVAKDGTLLRAHDGVDVEVKIGTLVLAPFAGTIVNPAAIWKPWDPERYGNVVVVRSTEATSRGYYAILVHLSTKSVKVGQSVARGQAVGRTGITGNADGTIPHLHFELRAPFQIEFHYAGVKRFLDDFDPLPSLQKADPHLH
jgi:murein DD-endopeptidase MepM/ murein hydrolase activator NlpD